MSGIVLFTLGVFVGGFGTLIGAGGGFLLVPVLLFLVPSEPPEVVTGISLAVVFANGLSGSLAYAVKRRIDYRSALRFAAASIPGALLGVLATHQVSRKLFEPVFGIVLMILALYLLTRRASGRTASPGVNPATRRRLVDRDGVAYEYSFDPSVGMALSAAVGFASSFLGIGGGIIHVPALVHLLNFPVHVATATSHLVLAITAGVATIQHAFDGSLAPGLSRLVFLAPGVVLGAQLGARLSDRVHGAWILRLLAVALLAVGARLVLS